MVRVILAKHSRKPPWYVWLGNSYFWMYRILPCSWANWLSKSTLIYKHRSTMIRHCKRVQPCSTCRTCERSANGVSSTTRFLDAVGLTSKPNHLSHWWVENLSNLCQSKNPKQAPHDGGCDGLDLCTQDQVWHSPAENVNMLPILQWNPLISAWNHSLESGFPAYSPTTPTLFRCL